MTVSELLSQSRAAHQRSHQHRGKVDKHGSVTTQPQLHLAGHALADALKSRLDAHALDPDHLDPAWMADLAANKGVSHDALIAFLGRYLTPAEARG